MAPSNFVYWLYKTLGVWINQSSQECCEYREKGKIQMLSTEMYFSIQYVLQQNRNESRKSGIIIYRDTYTLGLGDNLWLLYTMGRLILVTCDTNWYVSIKYFSNVGKWTKS